MLPVDAIDSELSEVRGLLFDLDDTLLTHGALSLEVYESLFALKNAGFRLIAVTGRPLGWGEVLLPQWPVDAIVVENGALLLSRKNQRVVLDDPIPMDERRDRTERLAELGQAVDRAFPTLVRAADAWLRRTDINWDIGETQNVPSETVGALETYLRAGGARATRSSIHAHATFDDCDKARGVLHALDALFGESVEDALCRYAYVGDSVNDASCFERFPLSVGVRNVERHLALLPKPPRFVTNGSMGNGFNELASVLLRARLRE